MIHNATATWWRSPLFYVPAAAVATLGAGALLVRAIRRDRVLVPHDGLTSVPEPRPPRMAVPEDYWGIAHDASFVIEAPSFASEPETQDPWGVTGCEKDHHCKRGAVPQPTIFVLELGTRPQQSSDYRVQIQIADPEATQANTIVQGQRWWIAGDPGVDLWGHTHDTPAVASSTCYGEDIEQRIDVVGNNLVRGRESRADFDCGLATPMQLYELERRTRKFRGRWVWQYEDYNKIVAKPPYATDRLYDLRIEPRDDTVALVGAIAPTLPALQLEVDVRWWRRPAVDA